MSHVLEAQRAAAHTRLGHLLTLTLCCAVLLQATCIPPQPLAPVAGLPEWQEIAAISVPGGARVNTIGGNLLLERTDLTIDTQLGPYSVGATWNSATRQWRWSFDGVQVVAGTYTDATGYANPFAALANGDASPGTSWVRVNYNACQALQIKTKGGLQHDFSCTGRPLYVHWSSSYEPYLGFLSNYMGDGELHTYEIRQCLANGGGCQAVFTIGYDDAGRVASITDRAGRAALFGYDASGRLAQARDALDVAKGWPGARYEYDATSGHLTAVTNSEGERVEYQYQNNRAITVRQIGLGNPTQTFAYEGKNAAGLHVTRHIDPLGNETRYRYDDDRQLREVYSMATADLVVRAWAAKRVTSLARPDGTVTTWSHANDDVASRVDPSGNVTSYTYQPNGVDRDRVLSRPVLAIADSLGPIESRSYDGSGRLVSIANGAGETTSFTYGADQMIASITDSAGLVTETSSYGQHGHATLTTRGGIAESLAYDAVGNLLEGSSMAGELSPGRGGIVSRSFDADRNVSSVLLADLMLLLPNYTRTLTMEHRSDNRPRWIRRPFGGDAEFRYDALGRLIERRDHVDGGVQTTTLDYDVAGRVVRWARPNGMTQEWSYDGQGRLSVHRLARNGVTENSASYAWTNGRVTSVSDQVYGAESYGYDAAGRIASVLYPGGERMLLSFDSRSRIAGASLRRPDGSVLRDLALDHDAADREVAVRDASATVLGRAFQSGRIAQARYGNGLVRHFAYDANLGTPAGVTMGKSGQPPVETTTTQFRDPSCLFAQQCISTQTTSSGSLAAQSWEKFWLLPQEIPEVPETLSGKRVGGWTSGSVNESLFYDELGNVGESDGAVHLYNAERNRLLQKTSEPAITYSYDGAGFVTARNGVPITWDAAGRIKGVGADLFAWDMFGRPASSTVAGVQTKRRFGGLVEADAWGTPTAIDLGEVRIDLIGASRRYRHHDYRANYKLVTDSSGDVVTHYEYGAFGKTTVFGDGSDPYRFVGGRAIGDLYVIGSRLYDPAVARFLAPDPIHQIINQYAYSSGNPALLADPSGAAGTGLSLALFASGWVGAQIGGAVGVGIGTQMALGAVGVFAFGIVYSVVGFAVVTGAVLMIYQAVYQERGAGFPFSLPAVIPSVELSNLGNLPAMTAPSSFSDFVSDFNRETQGSSIPRLPPVLYPGQSEDAMSLPLSLSCAPTALPGAQVAREWMIVPLVLLNGTLGSLVLISRRRRARRGPGIPLRT